MAYVPDPELDGRCQYCDVPVSGQSRRRGFCIACADELRDDDGHWGDLLREAEGTVEQAAMAFAEEMTGRMAAIEES